MTEIQWLCDILLNFKMSKEVKDRFIARIGEVEAKLAPKSPQPFGLPTQSPSTQAAIARQIAEDPNLSPPPGIAVTPQASQALQQRQQAISIAASGIIEKGRTSPRKF